jgi:hypothetical protein
MPQEMSMDDFEKLAPPESKNEMSFEQFESLPPPQEEAPRNPNAGMDRQCDDFINQAESAGINPAENPSVMAIAGMMNNVAQGLKNPEAMASALQDITTFGQGQKLSGPVNAYMMKKYFGAGDDALEKENLRQDTVREDNPYLPFLLQGPVGKAQSLVKTEGIIPSYLKPNTGKWRDGLRRYADEKYIKALGGNKKEMEEAIKLGDKDLLGIGRKSRNEGIIGPFSRTCIGCEK